MSTVIEKVEILSTENSTSATTGSIKTLGGIGVASNVFVGGTTFTNTIAESTLNNGVSVDGVLLKDNGVVIPSGGSIIGASGTAGANLTITSGTGTSSHGSITISTPASDVALSQGSINIIGGITSAGTNASNIKIRSGSNATSSGRIDITTPISSGTGSQLFIGTGLADTVQLLAGNELRMLSAGLLALSSNSGTNISTVAKTLTNPAANITILGGDHSGTATASNVLIASGKNTSSVSSGNLYMQALTNVDGSAGGSIQIKAGNATATTPAITIPNSVNIESTSTNPLSVAVVSTGGVGIKTATTEYSFHVSSSGKLIHTGGTVAPTSITPAAGRIVHVEGGATFTGITDTLGSHYTEAATVPQAVVAGRGTIWVRNDTPNTPMFTDDAGNDRVLWRAPSVMEKIGTTLTTSNTNLVFDQQLLPITGSSTVAAATTANNFIYQMTAPTNDSAVFNVRANTTVDKDIPHTMSSFSATTKKITAGDIAVNDFFGTSVGVDGDWVVVGSPNDDDGGADTGSAYVYYRHEGGSNMWGQKKKLVSNAPVAGNIFGFNVAISGNYIVVTSPYVTTNTGKAEIFFKDQGGVDNWGHIKTITADVPTANEYFGWSVDIDKDHIVVGVQNTPSNIGAAFIYRKDNGGVNNWGLVKKITHTGGVLDDNFGRAVSISGDWIAVGVVGRESVSPVVSDAGSVVLFQRNLGGANNWGQSVEIFPSDPIFDGQFGSVLMINGSNLITSALGMGVAYIYQYTVEGWSFINKIISSDGAGGSSLFGLTVAINDKIACVGASDDNKYLYIYEKNVVSGLWVEITKISPSMIVALDWLYHMDMDDQHIIWGMPEQNGGYALITRYTPYDIAHTGTESMNINYNTVLRPNEFGQVSFTASVDYTGENLYRNYIPVEKALTSNVLSAGDNFGHAVAVYGDYAVVSLRNDDTTAVDAGTVHVYWKNQGGIGNWGRLTTLVPTGLTTLDRFGHSVAIHGDNIIVGAPLDGGAGTNRGAVYIFNKDTGGVDNWGFVVRRVASDTADNDEYGTAVAIYEDYAVVGAPFNDDTASGSGSAYILEKTLGGANNWGERKKLVASDAGLDDNFGASVAIGSLSSDYAVVIGAPLDDHSTFTNPGSIYIFEKEYLGVDNWGQRVKKISDLAGNGHKFGFSVAMDGDYIIVGAPEKPSTSGEAYILNKDNGGVNNWGTTNTLFDDVIVNTRFGNSVSMRGRYAVVGNPGSSGNLGSVNVYYNTNVFDEWLHVARLDASDGDLGDKFGESVGIGGENIVVGAPFIDVPAANTGGAYMFSVGGRRLNSSLSITKVQ
jgi:hypothetical protein